ncbi:unnamed protein product [Hymenolepis diminuta]|uniref:Vesicle transport protein USE1 n=1 Tax=Hymenolepis diminuta TaxID=6216 RepID=A0A0R3SUT6_HYMDI|nr:unnamed protein product [Hymenolepis diminuta]VUZ46683.1 unnamed protein product [Hymenolepis diminuta]
MTVGVDSEANFVRLLQCTESLLASENLNYYEFLGYYQKLQELLHSLTESRLRPAAEFLRIYKRRLDRLSDRYQQQDYDGNSNTIDGFQKNIHRWLQYDSTTVERCNQSQKEFFFPLDPSESIKWLDHDDKIPSQNKESSESYFNHDNKSKSLPTRFLADVPNSCTRLRNLADQEARRSLGLDDSNSQKTAKTSGMLDTEVLERDKIAEEMLSLTNELKLTQMAIGDRLRADINVLSTSSSVAQANAESLASISRRVREELGSNFGLFIWILFLLTMVVFFWMIFFIKFTPKGTR